MPRPTTDHLAKAAYAAYGEAVDNRNFQGDPMPSWTDLPAPIRAAWKLAAEAVRSEVETSDRRI
jgi:hypothetical protein